MAAKTSEWRPGPTVCRCCLAEGCYKDISTEYFWMGKREVYAEMLSDTLNVSIAYSQSGGPNSNSRLICEPCISRLRDASDFRRQVLECEKTFMNHLDPGSSSVQKEVQLSLEEVKIERVKQEKKGVSDDEDFDDRVDFIVDNDDDDDDLDDEPLMKLATKVPKKEVDLLDLLDSTQITVKRKSTAKTKAPPAKKAKSLPTVKPSASKPSASAPKAEKKKKGLDRTKTEVSPSSTDAPKIVWKRKRILLEDKANAALLLEHSNAVVFRWQRGKFMCAYCPKICTNIHDIRLHSSEHNRLDIFENPQVRQLFPLKVEITDLSCTICNLPTSTIDHLKIHLSDVHLKSIDPNHTDGIIPFYLTGKELRCVHCDVQFDKFMTLFIHMNKHYPSFVCDTCGKAYSGQNKLRSHQAMHETGEFKCSHCDVVLPNRIARNRHVNDAHGPKERYRCPICDDHFDSYHNRLRHLNVVHGEKTEYKCTYCPAVFISCTSRYSHINGVHMRKRKKKKKKDICDSRI